MWLATEKSLTKHDEAHDVKDRVGGEMVRLQTIEMQQALKKWMNWEPQPANEKGDKANPFVFFGLGHCLGPDVIVVGDDDGGVHKGEHQWWKVAGLARQSSWVRVTMEDIHFPFVFEATFYLAGSQKVPCRC